MLQRLKTFEKSDLRFVEELDPTVPLPDLQSDTSWRESLRAY